MDRTVDRVCVVIGEHADHLVLELENAVVRDVLVELRMRQIVSELARLRQQRGHGQGERDANQQPRPDAQRAACGIGQHVAVAQPALRHEQPAQEEETLYRQPAD